MIDSDALGDLIAELVGEHVEHALAPLIEANAKLAQQNELLTEQVKALAAQVNTIQPEPFEVTGELVSMIASKAVEQIEVPQPIAPDVSHVIGEVLASAELEQRIAEAARAVAPPAPEPIAPDMEAIKALILEAIPAAKEGKPGVGVAGALKNAEGHLILTLSDGQLVDIGKIDGKDGKDGKNGETFTLDDFDIEPVDERSIKLCFERGNEVHTFELEFPVPVYRGVWREAESYARGDMVTWAGSTWHCDAPTKAKPGDADGTWTLAVKAGRPGRDKN